MYRKFQQKKIIIFTVIFSMLILISCTESTQNSPQIEENISNLLPPIGDLDTSKEYYALFDTDSGKFTIKLFDNVAPRTVENFINLTEKKFYNGTTFHRVLPGFMAQGGDPTGTGTGGPGYKFEDEFSSTLSHNKPGIFSMANSGPGTNGSQFFITFAPTPHLDGMHTIFGEVVSGIENAMNISPRDPFSASKPGDRINKITIKNQP